MLLEVFTIEYIIFNFLDAGGPQQVLRGAVGEAPLENYAAKWLEKAPSI